MLIDGPLPTPPRHDPEGVILPHNLEAERATLGAALVEDTAADYVLDRLQPEVYFRRAHQTLFIAMRELRRAGIALDFVTLKQHLGPKRLGDIGGPAYISALADGTPRATNVAHYAEMLQDLATKRALIGYAHRTVDLVVCGEHASAALVADADRRLLGLQNGHGQDRLADLQATAGALREDLEWRCAHRGELTGVETGFASINEITLGWQRGDAIVLAARPSIGKTTLALNTATAAARAGKHVAMFSLEMRRRQLEYRLLASLSGIPLTRLLGGHLGGSDFEKLAAAMEVMHHLPITIDDRAHQSAWEIRGACRRLQIEAGLDLVIIDYVQLMPGTLARKGATRNDEITDISRRLKVLADEVSAPVLLLSQLNRAADGRTDKRPLLSDLRESGALEQDADIVAFLHRRNHREGGTTAFILEKQRNGPTGTLNLTLDRDIVTFTDGGEDPPAAPAPDRAPRQRTFRQRWAGSSG